VQRLDSLCRSASEKGAFFVFEREKINDLRIVDRLIDSDGDIMYETERKLNQIRAEEGWNR